MENVKFSELGCSKEIKNAIADMGFEEATPIQTKAIPLLLEGKDIIGQAQTGTGKTAAFAIPAIDKVDVNLKKPQIIILCPTRELAVQVSEEFAKLGRYVKGLKTMPIYGGQPIDRQIKALRAGVQIIIGTPGRVIDHIKRKTLKLDDVNTIILDEADEMLNMGFREDIEMILESIGTERQTVFFSATMPKAILDLTKRYQKNPEHVAIAHKELTTPNINQYYLEVKGRDRIEVISRLLDVYSPKLSLVFCNTKRKVDETVASLQTRGYSCDRIHGDMKQQQRNQVMDRFKSGNIEILVATDVAARGIDVNDVECVFNLDVPQDEEYYVHRIGRTGRAGRKGVSFSFVSGREFFLLKDIMRYTKKTIDRHEVPSINDIEEIKTTDLMKRVAETAKGGGLDKYFKMIDKLGEENLTSLEVAATLIKMEMEKYKTEAKNVAEYNFSSENEGRRDGGRDSGRREGGRRDDSGMVRFFINAGRNISLEPRDVVSTIASETSIPGNAIGAISIYDEYSFVDIPGEHATEVLDALNNMKLKGKKVRLEKAKEKRGGSRGGSRSGSSRPASSAAKPASSAE